MAIETRTTLLDSDGRLRAWIDAGRGIQVWESQDLSTAGRQMFTPGDVDVKPHWSMAKAGRIETAEDAVWYRRAGVVARWTDSAAGWKAAYRFSEQLFRVYPSPELRTVEISGRHVDARQQWRSPIGEMYQTWTVERVSYETGERIRYPLSPATLSGEPENRPDGLPPDRPLDSLSFVGVILWIACDRKEL